MSVRSFRSVFMASAVAGAALGCYLVSLRVASERAALEQVETRIVLAQRDIRLLQTEIGTRARLAQLERWNVRVLSLSAPTADQILGDKFQLASLIKPERKPAIEAPVVLASAPARQAQPLELGEDAQSHDSGQLLHQAGLKLSNPSSPPATAREGAAAAAKLRVKPNDPEPVRAAVAKISDDRPATGAKKAGDNKPAAAIRAVTSPVRTANVDPLAPLPESSAAKGLRTDR